MTLTQTNGQRRQITTEMGAIQVGPGDQLELQGTCIAFRH
jgi:hypothetical protein